MASVNCTKDVKFYEFTGRTLVYPIAYNIYDFQKGIIKTAIFHNTLISLPSGLGKSLLAAVITFNFHRWFPLGKIVVLSQNRSYLTDQINAYNSYTTLSNESFAEVPANASDENCKIACEMPIILSSPQKFLSCLNKNLCKAQNLILLVVLETSKISKCQEYQEIVNHINASEFRLITFLDPVGMNSKIMKQVVEMFNISKMEVKNVDSPEIKDCTFSALVELVAVDISQHIMSIKDSFYSVFEKYGKKLKDAKLISGNVAGLTRSQVLKSKEKFLKNPPQNLNKVDRDDFVNCMTMCAFLCYGIEILHNWGVRVFYHYLFDSEKDENLKELMKNDENLINQMKLLDEYLKPNGKQIDSGLARIMHPKLLNLKNNVSQYFSNSYDQIDRLRIVVVCPAEYVISDIERLFSSLPDQARCQFVKTKAKCLSNEPFYKETIENFQNGVINVLVITNVVDEIMEIKSSVIICLEPIRVIFKLSYPRFHETTKKCLFIVTKGAEENKFEGFMLEKRHEQKPLDVSWIQEPVIESAMLFPEGFDPEFEGTSVREPKKSFRNSPAQKTILQFFSSKLASSSPIVFDSDASSKKSKSISKKISFVDESQSIFTDDFHLSHQSMNVFDERQPIANPFFEDPLQCLSDPFVKPSPVVKENTSYTDDSFDNLNLDITSNVPTSKVKNSLLIKSAPVSPSLVVSRTSPVLSNSSKFSWERRKNQKSKSNILETLAIESCPANNNASSRERKSYSKKFRSCDIGLEDLPNMSFVDDLFSDSSNSNASDHEEHQTKVKKPNSSKSITGAVAFSEEDFVFSESPMLLKNQKNLIPSEVVSTNTGSAKNSELSSFLSSTKRLNNNDSKVVDAQKRSACIEERPLFNDGEDDLFDDILWLNNGAKSNKRVFFDKYDATNSGSSANVVPVPSTLPTFPPKTMSAAFDSSSDFSRLQTIEESSQSRIPDFSLTEIPSEIFDDFVPASPKHETRSFIIEEKSKRSSLVMSPVLFSSKKLNRKRFSSSRKRNDLNGASITFDSFFDVSEENLQQLERRAFAASSDDKENATEEVKMVPSTPPPTDCDFDSVLFENEDDIFINDITNKAVETKADKNHEIPCKEMHNNVGYLEIISTSPSLFDVCNNTCDNAYKSSYVDASVTIPTKKLQLHPQAVSSPLALQNGASILNRSSTPFRDTPKNRKINLRKRSTPLFDESNNNFESPPYFRSDPPPTLREKIAEKALSDAEKKKRLFSNFTASIKQKLSISGGQNEENVTRVEETKATMSRSVVDSSDDDFPWLKKSSSEDSLNRQPCFKKPESLVIKNRFVSRNTTPGSLTDGSEVASSPTPPNNRFLSKKRSKLKRNLAEQFIDAEADVTDDDDEYECPSADECAGLSDDSFIDDDSSVKPENVSKYLKSIKSPDIPVGKFRIPLLTERQLKVNVYSQAVDHDPTYENDSFCVDEDESEIEDSYVPSVLTQMEERLSRRKVQKILPRTKQFKRLRIIEDSSPDSPAVRQNQRKRTKYFSSDSEG